MRYSATDRWLDWAAARRNDGPLLWIHGASVGELMAANPVVRRLTRGVTGLQVVYTHTSPSVEPWWERFPAEHIDYLPLDDTVTMSRMFEALRPSVVAVSRGDLWPGLVSGASDRNVPMGVIGGEISPSSSRLEWPWRSVFSGMYAGLAFVCASSSDDAGRFSTVGALDEVISVCGDPRADEVAEQVASVNVATGRLGRGTTLVAGSAEPEDEKILVTAFATLTRQRETSIVIVPHDPDPGTPQRIMEMARGAGISDSLDHLHVLNETGLLFNTYLAGTVAYVGGGFRKKGLHSVLEPAVFGIPVIVGPQWSHSSAAKRLNDHRALHPLDELRPAEHLAALWDELSDPIANAKVGLRGRNAIGTGAAQKTAESVIPFLQ